MSIFQRVVDLLKVKTFLQNATKEASQMESATPGWKTTEFWLTLLSQAGTLIGTFQGLIPPQWAAILSVAITAVYTIARTVAKAVADIKSVPATTTVVTGPAIATTTTKP